MNVKNFCFCGHFICSFEFFYVSVFCVSVEKNVKLRVSIRAPAVARQTLQISLWIVRIIKLNGNMYCIYGAKKSHSDWSIGLKSSPFVPETFSPNSSLIGRLMPSTVVPRLKTIIFSCSICLINLRQFQNISSQYALLWHAINYAQHKYHIKVEWMNAFLYIFDWVLRRWDACDTHILSPLRLLPFFLLLFAISPLSSWNANIMNFDKKNIFIFLA